MFGDEHPFTSCFGERWAKPYIAQNEWPRCRCWPPASDRITKTKWWGCYTMLYIWFDVSVSMSRTKPLSHIKTRNSVILRNPSILVGDIPASVLISTIYWWHMIHMIIDITNDIHIILMKLLLFFNGLRCHLRGPPTLPVGHKVFAAQVVRLDLLVKNDSKIRRLGWYTHGKSPFLMWKLTISTGPWIQ